MTRRLLARLVALVAAVSVLPGLLALDSFVTSSTAPARRAQVLQVAEGDTGASTYDQGAATILLNGLGRDISVDQARVLTPSLGRYGRVLALQYGAVFDPDTAADRVHAAFTDARMPRPWYLSVVTSSMGDVRGLELIASLQQRHPDIAVEGFVVNTGPGPLKRERVRGRASQWVIDSGCSTFVPGQVTLGLTEVVNQGLQGHVHDLSGAARAYALGQDYRGSVVMDQLCSLTRASAVVDPPAIRYAVYLKTGTPDADVVVDNDGAYHDWLEVLPMMGVRTVRGATHDNFSFRPDLFNPLFADDLMPAIRATRPRPHESLPPTSRGNQMPS